MKLNEADEVIIRKSELHTEMRHKRKKTVADQNQTMENETDPRTLPGL
jgi:hypothetical protein